MKSLINNIFLLVFLPTIIMPMQEPARKTLKDKIQNCFSEFLEIPVFIQNTLDQGTGNEIVNRAQQFGTKVALLNKIASIIDGQAPAPTKEEKKWAEDISGELCKILLSSQSVFEMNPQDFNIVQKSENKRLYEYIHTVLTVFNEQLSAPNQRISRYLIALHQLQKRQNSDNKKKCQAVLDQKKEVSGAKSKPALPSVPPTTELITLPSIPGVCMQPLLEVPSASQSLLTVPKPPTLPHLVVCGETDTVQNQQQDPDFGMTDTLILTDDFKDLVEQHKAGNKKMRDYEKEYDKVSEERDQAERAVQTLTSAAQASIKGKPGEIIKTTYSNLREYLIDQDERTEDLIRQMFVLKASTPSQERLCQLRAEIIARKEERNNRLNKVEREKRAIETTLAKAQELVKRCRDQLLILDDREETVKESHNRIENALREVNRFDFENSLQNASGVAFVQQQIQHQ